MNELTEDQGFTLIGVVVPAQHNEAREHHEADHYCRNCKHETLE